ncbi:MAG: ATP-binding protein, partial [Holophaga sp.]|nr:ATP-binding protein [Holophaga sp.]
MIWPPVPKFRLFLALFLVLAMPVRGQGAGRLPMKGFGVEQGLNSEVVWALAQDRQGVIWAGTDVGLHRFDGRRFEPYEGKLPSPKVQSLWASPAGDLFVGTLQGLAKISKGRVQTYGAAEGLPPQAILRIGMDEKGALWVLSDQGIFREFAPGRFASPVRWPEGASASALWCLPEGGRILVGRGRFVGTWNAANWTWKWELVDLLGPAEGLASVGMDGVGSLWVKTSSGRLLNRHEGNAWQVQKSAAGKSLESISEMETDRDGWVWVDSSNGLIRLKGREIDLPRWDLPYIAGSNVMVDREGTRWVRSPRGIFRTAGQGLWESFGLAQGLPSPLVFEPLRDGAGRLWLGTRGGLCLATPQGWKTVFLGSHYLWLELAPDGAIWTAGAPGGIVHRIDPERLTEESFRVGPIPLSQNARGVVVDAQGRVWLGDKANGLAVGTPGPRGYAWSKVEGPGAPTGVITSMFKDHLGRLIVLHENKVSWLLNDQWELLPEVLEEGPYQMALAAEGDIFLTYRNSSKITRHRQTNGVWKRLETIEPYRHMANMMIYSITVDSRNRLWMGTNRGVGRYDLTDRSLALFGPMDGLPSSDCVTHALLVEPNLDVWVGTVAGLAHFSGSLERATTGLPAPLLLGVRETRRGTLLDAGDLELAPGYQGLEVQFVVPSYLNPSRLGFEARIQNSDNPWRPLAEPVARFGALSPGTHDIEIRGTYGPDHPGAVLTVRISVLPAWYESWWARTLMGLLSLGLMGGVYVLRIKALSRKNAHLQQLVAHRTDQLHKALDRAERASNFKSLFLATTTHELRTPLNAILGFSRLLTGGSLPQADGLKYASHIRGAAVNMLQLVNDLLDLSKIEAGQLRVENKPFEPRQVVDEAILLLADRAAEKGLDLAADINSDVPVWVMGDAFRVRQMLVNLLSNAVKFTDFGWIHIELSFADDYLKVAVTDTGPGVPEDVLPTLFQAYQQGETTAKQQGTGLGLSITRQLAQLMGGDAAAENAPNGGAT